MRVTLEQHQIRFDGRAELVLAGEIHYFRLSRGDWAQRLDLLVEAGADTVASYIPWVVHELADGTVDLTGRTRPELDLGAFIDLAAARGLRFLARPGPFTMGELRSEGVPPRLVQQHPEIRPIGWGGRPAPTADLDYLAPAFLAETRDWYHNVGAVLAPRMAAAGGPVIAVQLDNEIGMLAWVSNTPALTEHAVADFAEYVKARFAQPDQRYPGVTDWTTAVRSPTVEFAAALRVDLAWFMRDRFARYVAALREFATDSGFGSAPLLINIHGTGGGRATSFPIGISQLMDTYRDIPGLAAGSDHYLGTLDFAGAAELHMVHAFLDAVNGSDQPLTSLEFEAGTGDYGGDLGALTDPSAVVLKTRLLLAQGNRMFNWYLFAGGTNFLDPRPGEDGTHRFGITGQRHGSAAPVSPEGHRGPAFASTRDSMQLARIHDRWAAHWTPEYDDLALGFVADHYATEYSYPGNAVMPDLIAGLTWARGGGPGSVLPRMLLGAGFRYTAIDLQRPGPAPRLIVLGSPPYLDPAVQQRLLDHVERGGALLLVGALPERDLQGRPCRILADALGLGVLGEMAGEQFPSVLGAGWAAGRPETRVGRLQRLSLTGGEPFLTEALTGDPCGVEMEVGTGAAIVIAADYAGDPAFFRELTGRLGVAPGLTHDAEPAALIAATTVTPAGDRFLHVVNTTGFTLTARFTLHARTLFDGRRLHLGPRSGRLVPLRLSLGGNHITGSTAEMVRHNDSAVTFRLDQPENTVTVNDVRLTSPIGDVSWTVPLS